MKTRIAWLTILCLALAAIPTWAQTLYENGPINGTVDAWTFDFGFTVSDTFALSSDIMVGGFDFGVWEYPGDVLSSVDWSITTAENGGTVFGSGTASGKNLTDQFISTNQFGFDVDKIAVSGLNVGMHGGTYWLNLMNAQDPRGDPTYWDENSGAGCKSFDCPSKASEFDIGTVPSESFTITGTGTTPEPSSFLLFGSGILALAGAMRRKLF